MSRVNDITWNTVEHVSTVSYSQRLLLHLSVFNSSQFLDGSCQRQTELTASLAFLVRYLLLYYVVFVATKRALIYGVICVQRVSVDCGVSTEILTYICDTCPQA